MIGGRTQLVFLGHEPGWLIHQFRQALSELNLDDNARVIRDDEWLVGANLSFNKATFERLQGFDEAVGMRGKELPQLSGDEYEFCLRVQSELTKEVWFDPEIKVHHQIPVSRISAEYFEGRFYGQGISSAAIRMKANSGSFSKSDVVTLLRNVVSSDQFHQIKKHAEELSGPDKEVYLQLSTRCLWQQMGGVITASDRYLSGQDSLESNESYLNALETAWSQLGNRILQNKDFDLEEAVTRKEWSELLLEG